MEELGITPFEVDPSCQQKAPVDMLRAAESQIESLNDFRQRMAETQRGALFDHQIGKARNSAHNSRKSDPKPYRVVDQICLDMIFLKVLWIARKNLKRSERSGSSH